MDLAEWGAELLKWARERTQGYPNVDVRTFKDRLVVGDMLASLRSDNHRSVILSLSRSIPMIERS